MKDILLPKSKIYQRSYSRVVQIKSNAELSAKLLLPKLKPLNLLNKDEPVTLKRKALWFSNDLLFRWLVLLSCLKALFLFTGFSCNTSD